MIHFDDLNIIDDAFNEIHCHWKDFTMRVLWQTYQQFIVWMSFFMSMKLHVYKIAVKAKYSSLNECKNAISRGRSSKMFTMFFLFFSVYYSSKFHQLKTNCLVLPSTPLNGLHLKIWIFYIKYHYVSQANNFEVHGLICNDHVGKNVLFSTFQPNSKIRLDHR